MAKIIIIKSCLECPLIGTCKAWKKLTPQQRFKLKFGVGIGAFILKECPLNDYPLESIEDAQIETDGR